jgi:Fis family transcriptional regulator, factor for inversion stimulation protein
VKSVREILYELELNPVDKERENNMKDQLETLVAQMYESGILYSEAMREFKKRFIMNVIRQNCGNQCKAARELGMHRNTLSRTLVELKLDIRELRGGLSKNPRYTPQPKPIQPAAMAAAAGSRSA